MFGNPESGNDNLAYSTSDRRKSTNAKLFSNFVKVLDVVYICMRSDGCQPGYPFFTCLCVEEHTLLRRFILFFRNNYLDSVFELGWSGFMVDRFHKTTFQEKRIFRFNISFLKKKCNVKCCWSVVWVELLYGMNKESYLSSRTTEPWYPWTELQLCIRDPVAAIFQINSVENVENGFKNYFATSWTVTVWPDELHNGESQLGMKRRIKASIKKRTE